MFYCEKCRIEKDWPGAIMAFSRGACEVCGTVDVCHDAPSCALPARKAPVAKQTIESVFAPRCAAAL